MANVIASETHLRAARSGGTSDSAIYEMVERTLDARRVRGEIAVDLGCGTGALYALLKPHFQRCIGVDAVRYDGLSIECEFIKADLNATPYPLESKIADAVFAVETVEHLENPRMLLREMARLVKPNGWIVVTTPNQLSALSLGTLLFKKRFSAFQDVHYPAHVTALLESDLLRIAGELGLRDAAIEYSQSGRIVLTSLQYPRFISRALPRLCSDNLLLIARAP